MSSFWRRTTQWSNEVALDLFVNRMIGVVLLPRPMRWRALRAVGMDVQRCSVGPAVYFSGRRVSLGRGAHVMRECYFDAAAPIIIGVRSAIGARTMLITGAHKMGGPDARCGRLAPAPLVIGDGVWVGAGVMVLPGVTIGDGCVIGAGAVVVRDCAPHGIYAGIPAVRVRDLDVDQVVS